MQKINIVIIVSLFLQLATNCMQNDEQIKAQFCPLIKPTKGESSADEYKKVIELLKANGLSTCSCMQYLSEQKRKKAYAALTREWRITNEGWRIFGHLKQQLTDYDSSDKNIHVKIDPSVPTQVHNKIVELIVKNGRPHQIGIYTDQQNTEFPAFTFRPLVIRTKVHGENIESYITNFGPHILAITPNFINAENIMKEGILYHELEHINRQHNAEYQFIKEIADISNPHYFSEKKFHTSNSFLKFQRMKEAEATRLPTACNNSEAALALFRYYLDIATNYKDPKKDPHPAPSKDREWTSRLAILRGIESLASKEAEKKKEGEQFMRRIILFCQEYKNKTKT